MKCDFNLLEDYIEGFLKGNQKQKVEDHLQGCEYCQSVYKQLADEQKTLFTQLNKPMMSHSQTDFIMQRIQTKTKRKKTWNTFKAYVIGAAVIILSFALYYSNYTPNEEAKQIDGSAPLTNKNTNEQTVRSTAEIAPSLHQPFLDVSIDEVIENGDDMDIYYRVKFKHEYQQYYNHLYEQIKARYPYIESPDQLQTNSAQDEFFGKMTSQIQFAIRDEAGQLIINTNGPRDEKPIINSYGSSGKGTNILGEMIYNTSVPSYTHPATFEVLAMEADVFDLFEVEVNAEQLQSFQFKNAVYTVDAIEIKQDTLYLQLSTKGEPEIRPHSWEMVINNQLIPYDRATSDVINNRTVYSLQFDGYKQIPRKFTLVPYTVEVKKQIEPIILQLN